MKRLLFVWVLCLFLGNHMAWAQEWRLTVVGASGGDPRWSPSGPLMACIEDTRRSCGA